MDIYAFKLTSGEEFIAELVSDSSDHCGIQNPVVVMTQPLVPNPDPRDPTQYQLGFQPWFAMGSAKSDSKDRKINLNTNHIMFKTNEVPENIRSGYDQIYGAGIITPEEPNILIPG